MEDNRHGQGKHKFANGNVYEGGTQFIYYVFMSTGILTAQCGNFPKIGELPARAFLRSRAAGLPVG